MEGAGPITQIPHGTIIRCPSGASFPTRDAMISNTSMLKIRCTGEPEKTITDVFPLQRDEDQEQNNQMAMFSSPRKSRVTGCEIHA